MNVINGPGVLHIRETSGKTTEVAPDSSVGRVPDSGSRGPEIGTRAGHLDST